MLSRSITLAAFVVVLAVVAGCSDSGTGPSPGDDYTFPLAEGNAWEYNSQFVTITLSEGCRVVLDTLDGYHSLEIARRETLQDTLACYMLVQTAVYDSLEWWSAASYYEGDENGLWNLAYETGGGYGGDPKPVVGQRLVFRGHPLSDVRGALSALAWGGLASVRSDSLIFEDPPVRSLAYPLYVDLQWTYREPGAPWAIDKRVTDRSSISVPAGTYRCYAVRWLIDIWDEDGQWDEDIDWVDHFCDTGLVKRTLILHDVLVTGPDDPGVIDTIDLWQEYVLTSENID